MGISLINLEKEVECYLVCPKRTEANFIHKIRPTLLKEELVFWRLSFSTKIKSIWQPLHLSTLRWPGILTFSLIVDITLALGVDVALTLTQKKKKEKKRELIDIPIPEQHKYNRTQDFVQTKHDDSLSTSFSNN